jgi:hypothetical protein
MICVWCPHALYNAIYLSILGGCVALYSAGLAILFALAWCPNDDSCAARRIRAARAEYDSDKNVHVFGFGGIVKGTPGVSHCFALNRNEAAPEVRPISRPRHR